MANKALRGEKMQGSFVFRVSASDKELIEEAASRNGMTSSGFIRSLLIKERVIPPSYVPNAKVW